ncbi:hypothetical protein AOLI_G00248610 [Acnodon oligacanthus]
MRFAYQMIYKGFYGTWLPPHLNPPGPQMDKPKYTLQNKRLKRSPCLSTKMIITLNTLSTRRRVSGYRCPERLPTIHHGSYGSGSKTMLNLEIFVFR